MAEHAEAGREASLSSAALDAMGVGVVILDGAGRVVRHNRQATRMLGPAIADGVLVVSARWWATPTADGGTVPLAAGTRAARALGGEPCAGVDVVWQGGTAAGSRFVVTSSPVSDASGAPTGAVLTFTELAMVRGAEGPAEPATASPLVELAPRVGVLLVDAGAGRGETAGILRGAGFAVAEAGSASEAMRVAAATSLPLNVLLTALTLDEDSGPELAHRLLQIRPRLSVLYMSDHPWGALLPPRTAQGGRGLLRKPCSAETLIDAVTQSAVGEGDPAQASPSLGRVLLVDDDAAMRLGAAGLLRDEGFEVAEASDGRAAMHELERADHDVVVSDINMPGMSGIDLLRQVRTRDIDVPVILMTAAPRIESASTAVAYGAYRYLSKPVDARELVEVVELAIRNGRLARLRREAQAMAGHDAWQPSDSVGQDLQLENALANLWLEFQPLVRVVGGRASAFEALVRTGEHSLRSPLLLIAAAEQQGRAGELAREIRRLAAGFFELPSAGADLHVNITASDLEDPTLYAADAPLSRFAHRVVLELNERAVLVPGPRFEEQIRALRAVGFRLALDDLGSGHAGLTTFSMLAPDMVKLDPSLVRGIHATAAKRRTLAAMIALCHDMRIEVVAEGVELEAERACLIDLGCDLLQGYLLARPGRGLVAPSP